MNGAANGHLLRLIAQFNLLPSIELHPDRRSDYAPDPVWQALAAGRFGHRHLSARVLEVEGLHGDWADGFETRERRLALLGWQGLERMMTLAGIGLNAAWIATRIHRDEVASLKARLGRQDYAFAVGRARFLGLSVAWPAPGRKNDLLDWFQRAGRACIEACIQQQPRSLSRRLELRLAPNAKGGTVADRLPALEPCRAISLIRKLAPEIGPECVSLLS